MKTLPIKEIQMDKTSRQQYLTEFVRQRWNSENSIKLNSHAPQNVQETVKRYIFFEKVLQRMKKDSKKLRIYA